jgi:hypothetical protein
MNSKQPDNYIRTVLLILASFCGLLLVVVVYGGNLSELFGRTSKEQIRFFVMLAGALLCAVLAHTFLGRWFLACLASGAAFSLIIQVIAFLSAGHLDPFFPIPLVVGCLLGFAVAAPVGLILHLGSFAHKASMNFPWRSVSNHRAPLDAAKALRLHGWRHCRGASERAC